MDRWGFKRETNIIAEGNYRMRIEEAEKTLSKAGNDMIKLTLSVSGQNRKVWNYIVFMDDNPEITNAKLTQLYDSFDIPEGTFDLPTWVGKVGAGSIKHDDYMGEKTERVTYFIKKEKQGDLPPWDEPKSGGGAAPSPDGKQKAGGEVPDEDDVPF